MNWYAFALGMLITMFFPLSEFQWYRRVRRGSWAQATGYFYGKRWVYICREIHNDAKEWWP